MYLRTRDMVEVRDRRVIVNGILFLKSLQSLWVERK